MVKLDIEIILQYTVLDPTCDFVFNIHPAQTKAQSVVEECLRINDRGRTDLPTHLVEGNRWLRLRAEAGPLTVHYTGTVTIDHFMTMPEQLLQVPVNELPSEVLVYLYPSRYCQSDRLQKFALAEFGHLPAGYARVNAIAEWVRQRITFQPQTSTPTTSAVDTLIERVGVCRDFAHVMVALCRALTIPARFTTGIDYGAAAALGPPDFHAYVEVFLGGRWYICDASGLATPMGLVRLGTGRDAADVAFATIFGAVQSSIPRIKISAVNDPANNIVIPSHTANILSTDF